MVTYQLELDCVFLTVQTTLTPVSFQTTLPDFVYRYATKVFTITLLTQQAIVLWYVLEVTLQIIKHKLVYQDVLEGSLSELISSILSGMKAIGPVLIPVFRPTFLKTVRDSV